MKRLSHVKVLLLPSVADPAPAATPRTPLKFVINDGSNGPGLSQKGPGLSTGPGKLKWNGPYPASFRLKGIGLGNSSAQASAYARLGRASAEPRTRPVPAAVRRNCRRDTGRPPKGTLREGMRELLMVTLLIAGGLR